MIMVGICFVNAVRSKDADRFGSAVVAALDSMELLIGNYDIWLVKQLLQSGDLSACEAPDSVKKQVNLASCDLEVTGPDATNKKGDPNKRSPLIIFINTF